MPLCCGECTTGLAFKAEGQAAVLESDEEREARKKQLQLEVEQLKTFLLSISKAWEDLLVEMDDGYGGMRRSPNPPAPAPLNCLSSLKCKEVTSTAGTMTIFL